MDVLVIEHECLAQQSLLADLSRLGPAGEIRSASTEKEAQRILSSFRPDIIFLDMSLPDRGAFRIADFPWEGKIPMLICMTTFEPQLVAALSAHRVEHLVRPIRADELSYVMTWDRRPNPINAAENLERLFDAATSLSTPIRKYDDILFARVR